MLINVERWWVARTHAFHRIESAWNVSFLVLHMVEHFFLFLPIIVSLLILLFVALTCHTFPPLQVWPFIRLSKFVLFSVLSVCRSSTVSNSLMGICLYRDVRIAAITSFRTSLATLTVVMCNTSQCKLRSVRVNSGMLNVICIVTYYTLPPLEWPDSFWIAMAFSRWRPICIDVAYRRYAENLCHHLPVSEGYNVLFRLYLVWFSVTVVVCRLTNVILWSRGCDQYHWISTGTVCLWPYNLFIYLLVSM